ncbi:hypothetical protein [Kribbella sp. NPDC048915]|uniref:hypothetical protein n=1 Tax=Kribbella sp. NPDC048915 TaxID=3155148 RepID=UPI0033C6B0AD
MNIKKVFSTKGGRLLVAAVLGAGVLVGVTVAANGAVRPDCKTLSYPLCARSVAAKQVVDNSIPAGKLVPADRAAFLKDLGKAGVTKNFEPVTIAKIGGSFKTNKTAVGEFTLQPGTWLLNSTAVFARTVAGEPGTRPQLALRVGATTEAFGEDFGTILGAEISPAKDRELTGSTVKVVTVKQATKVGVYAFGYNDDASAAGSAQITAAASIAAVQIG